MAFTNPEPEAIRDLLRSARTIAVVGLSDNPQRPSYGAASALLEFGYHIVPVNPALAVWEGFRAFSSLHEAVASLGPSERIDIVDVFRRAQHVSPLVDDCLRLKLPALWLQLGVIDERAAERAVAGGMQVVMDRCIKVERTRIG
jgi:predicted CoA-binding protein